MRLVVLSGKGGTGKTTIAASLAELSSSPMVVDCDVDAANLQLLLGVADRQTADFSGGKIAILDHDRCIQCNRCGIACRFDAIDHGLVKALSCEGCGFCAFVCPRQALTLVDQVTAQVALTETAFGWLSRAEMQPGATGSGKLVTAVRNQASQALDDQHALTILDGPPGIGCPVMATLSGCDAALVVLEPSHSSQLDFQRLLELLRQFDLATYACINRFDLSPALCRELEQACARESLPIVGWIPFDPLVRAAQRQSKSLFSYEHSPAARAIDRMWETLSNMIGVDDR